jgi:hypothetical protein
MGVSDAILAVLIAGAALTILYRTTWRSGGRCAGCSGGCAPPARPRGEPLVRLGSPAARPPDQSGSGCCAGRT